MPVKKEEAGLGLCLRQGLGPAGFGKGGAGSPAFPTHALQGVVPPFPPCFPSKVNISHFNGDILTFYWRPVSSSPCRWASKTPLLGLKSQKFLGEGRCLFSQCQLPLLSIVLPDSHWLLGSLLAKSGRSEPAETPAKSWLLLFFLSAFSFDIWETNPRYSQTR